MVVDDASTMLLGGQSIRPASEADEAGNVCLEDLYIQEL
jgi:hypothetical protein